VTRRTRLAIVAVSAVLLLAAFGTVQFVNARTPLLSIPAVGHQADLDAVARATRCGDLRQSFQQHLMVWKGGVRDGHDAEVEQNLAMMRAILRRIQALSEQGRCGG
jgi:hypothetical protein